MTEQEYIDATNLAKLRIARNAVADCIIPDGGLWAVGGFKLLWRAIFQNIDLCIDELEKRVDKEDLI